MITSANIAAIAEALNKVQAVMEGAKRTSENPYYRSKYADLSEVWETCRKPLADNGLCVIQSIASELNSSFEGKVNLPIKDSNGRTTSYHEGTMRYIHLNVTSRLLHTSEQWFEDTISLPIEADPQSLGKATTYLRRYAMMALIGIAPEDDDGEDSAGKKREQPPATKQAGKSFGYKLTADGYESIIGESPDDKPGKTEHWCEIHNTAFFKGGKMKVYAHPIAGTQPTEWCNEKVVAKPEAVPVTTGQAEKPPTKPVVVLDMKKLQADLISLNWHRIDVLSHLKHWYGCTAATVSGCLAQMSAEQQCEFGTEVENRVAMI